MIKNRKNHFFKVKIEEYNAAKNLDSELVFLVKKLLGDEDNQNDDYIKSLIEYGNVQSEHFDISGDSNKDEYLTVYTCLTKKHLVSEAKKNVIEKVLGVELQNPGFSFKFNTYKVVAIVKYALFIVGLAVAARILTPKALQFAGRYITVDKVQAALKFTGFSKLFSKVAEFVTSRWFGKKVVNFLSSETVKQGANWFVKNVLTILSGSYVGVVVANAWNSSEKLTVNELEDNKWKDLSLLQKSKYYIRRVLGGHADLFKEKINFDNDFTNKFNKLLADKKATGLVKEDDVKTHFTQKSSNFSPCKFIKIFREDVKSKIVLRDQTQTK